MSTAQTAGAADTAGVNAGAALRHAVLIGVIFALAWSSLAILGPDKIAPIWPANGVLLAVLLRSPRRRWFLWLAEGYIGIALAAIANGGDLATNLGLAFMNLVEVGVSATIIRQVVGRRPDLSRLRHVAVFGLAALASAAVGAGGAGLLLGWAGRPDAIYSAAIWTLANGLGQMIGAPVVLAMSPWRRMWPAAAKNLIPALAAALILAAVTAAVFNQSRYDILFLVFVPLLVLVFHLESPGAALGIVTTAFIATALTVTGYGPMLRLEGGATEKVLLLQVFLLTCVVVAFPIAAVLADRRRAQDRVSASEARLRTLSDFSRDVVIRLNLDRQIIDVSPSCRRYGYEPLQLIGRHGGEFNHPNDRAVMAAVFDDISADQGSDVSRTREWRVRTAAGDWIRMEGHVSLVRDAEGQPREYVLVVRDIEERQAAAVAVARSEARYRFLAENSRDLVLQFDVDGNITYASAAARQFGYEPEDLVGLNSFDLTHPDDVKRVKQAMAAANDPEADGPDLVREWRVRNAAGDYVWIEGNPSVSYDAETTTITFRDTVRDVSRRKALEEDLARKRAEAEASEAARRSAEAEARERLHELARLSRVLSVGEFATSIAHELNQPIAAIVTNGDASLRWLSRDPPDLKEVRAAIERTIRDANRAAAVVSRTRAMMAKTPAAFAALDINACIEGVLLITEEDLRRRQVTTQLILAAPPPQVIGDPIQLQQVLLNLVRNAVEAMTGEGAGKRVLTIISAATESGQVQVSVRDTGPGLDAEVAERLFEGFFTTKEDGVGLGLAISRSIIEAHGGRLWVEPGGDGAAFHFTLQAAGGD